MGIGKYTSLQEAREKDKLKRFIKEHPSNGDKKQFDDLLTRMVKTQESKRTK